MPANTVNPWFGTEPQFLSFVAAAHAESVKVLLDFVGRHGIEARTEHFPFDRVNDAIEHLRSGKARYRVVLEH